MSTELLNGRPDAAREPLTSRIGRRVRRHRLALVVGGLLVVGALAADQWQQQRELDRMLETMQSGEQQITTTDRYFSGVIAYYSPLIYRAAPLEGVRAGFQDDVNEGAGSGLAAVASTSAALDGLTVLPWHQHLRAARAAYQERIAAWQTYLNAVTVDADALFHEAEGFAGTATTTTDALLLALPWTSDATDRARIDGVLTAARS